MSASPPSQPKTPSEVAAEHFARFHTECNVVFQQSNTEPNLSKITKSHEFVEELNLWCELIGDRREVELLRVAQHEYEYSLLILAQGHYRHAFKSLRLVLELSLQAIHLSANELRLREWLSSRVDTSWSTITDKAEGIFSPRFSKGFFPSFEQHVAHYAGMAVLLYRECSECVHGSVQKHIRLPTTIIFDQPTFDLWHSKAEIMRLVVHSALALRYFNDIKLVDQARISSCLSHLTQVTEIKAIILAGQAAQPASNTATAP